MVQEFQVLRCCGCEIFQVHQVKKAKKWSCKLCTQKQSYIKVYGQGSGPDCRRHVQKLNMCRGETADGGFQQAHCIPEESTQEQTYDHKPQQEEWVGDESSSRWQQYLEDEAEADGEALVPEGMESFTTDREQFDRRTSAQRKERRQKFRDQRVSQQSGGWYQKPSNEHRALYNSTMSIGRGVSASPFPACNSTKDLSRPPYNSGQHKQALPYPSLQPQQEHPISGEYEHDSGPYASYQNPKTISEQVSAYDQGTNGHSVQRPAEAQRLSGVWGLSDNNDQVKTPLRQNNIGSTKEKSTDDSSRLKVPAAAAVLTSSKWSLFIDASNNQKTDSESDVEDENNADDINQLGCEEHDRFRDRDSGMRTAMKSATVTTMQENPLPYAEAPNFSVRGWSDTPLFSTEDDLDDIISI